MSILNRIDQWLKKKVACLNKRTCSEKPPSEQTGWAEVSVKWPSRLSLSALPPKKRLRKPRKGRGKSSK